MWMHQGLFPVAVLLVLAHSAAASEVSPLPPTTALQIAAKSLKSGDFAGATAALQTLDGESIPAGLRTEADLLLGIALLRQKRMGEAAARLEAARAHPLLSDYALYYLAQARRQAGRPDLAAEALGQLVAQGRQSVLLDRATRQPGRC